MKINEFIKEKVENIFEEIVKIRRKIHMNPELGYEEYETSKLIKNYLDENGIEYKESFSTGIVATIYNDKDNGYINKTVATRADIDALPIFEENDVEYRSKNDGKMHACGHDAHTSIQLGVAKILNENKDKWQGTVRFFFQPAEETDGGAKQMIELGELNFLDENGNNTNRKIDRFFALHMAPEIETGKIGLKYGKAHATASQLNITVKGVSAHAALPHKGVDAIVISAKVIEFIQSIISRRVNPLEEAVISMGTIHGGTANNVICDKVEMRGTIRTLTMETKLFIIDEIKRDLPKFVESLGGEVIVETKDGYAPVFNDLEVAKEVEENIIDLYGNDTLELIENPRMDVEDVSYFLNEVKGVFFRLGTRNEEKGCIYDLHHPKFNVDEESIKYGIGLQLKNILEALK